MSDRDPSRDPSRERLLEVYEYKDGILFNRIDRGRRGKRGARVGSKTKRGYLYCTLDSLRYGVHRLIYIMHNGDNEEGLVIDHINGIKDDNRIENLRVVTYQENAFNTQAKGYYWVKEHQKWKAHIGVGGKRKFLGLFDNKEDAAQAYQVAKEKYHIIEKR